MTPTAIVERALVGVRGKIRLTLKRGGQQSAVELDVVDVGRIAPSK
jgi:hypothetical protein